MLKQAARRQDDPDDGMIYDLNLFANFERADQGHPLADRSAVPNADPAEYLGIRAGGDVDAHRDFGTDLDVLSNNGVVYDDDSRGMDLGSRVNKLG